MEISYDLLEKAAEKLQSAAGLLGADTTVRSELGSESRSPDSKHGDTAVQRKYFVTEFTTLLSAQSAACTQTVALFKLLDAQIAAQTVTG